MSKKTIGVLAMAYGTPASLDEAEAYYTHIRRGRKPSPEQLQELIDRYVKIGGVSPLNEITRKQTEGLERILNQTSRNLAYRVYMGMKHANPFIEDAVKQMAEDGIREAVGLVFAPHYSMMSIGAYMEAAKKGAEQFGGPSFTFVMQWHMQPQFLQAVARRLQAAMNRFPAGEREQVRLLFTAHSLPERILQMNDPYPQQLRETAAKLAEMIGHANWGFAWQSAGRTPEPWLGPDVLDVLRQLAKQGTRSVLICPVGFVADHLEILYDIDVECQALASELGMTMVRTAMLNADEDFLQALAAVVWEHTKRE
ncbi:ferrochelatase [Effusibacillus pohliae]|uniref:ferrochelatase n=1 Tax=Effusibacillus pohliae TaxID=232270 RepID=UPI00036A85E6|nr:ferrochelatase [Effusibacillus pohliae]